MTNKLFEYIMQNGVVSEKKSVIDFFSKKDKVYTKKVAVPGDKVVVNKYAGTEVKYEREELIIVKQSDILAIVE